MEQDLVHVCTLPHNAGNHVLLISQDTEKQSLPGHLIQPPEIPNWQAIPL